MRETKYRFWDTENKIMIQGCPSLIIDSSDGTIYNLLADSYMYWKSMQWTVLTDRKGTEIFEGDIAEMEAVMVYPDGDGDSAEINMLYIGEVVILPSKGVCLRNPKVIDRNDGNKTWKHKGYKTVAAYRSRVIGNVFQNQDLING